MYESSPETKQDKASHNELRAGVFVEPGNARMGAGFDLFGHKRISQKPLAQEKYRKFEECIGLSRTVTEAP